MGNEGARKLALNKLRFEQYPKAQRHEVPSPYPIPSLDPSYRLLSTAYYNPPYLKNATFLILSSLHMC